MRYQELQPSFALRPFVDCYWNLTGTHFGILGWQRILPDGKMEMFIHRSGQNKRLCTANVSVEPRSFINGQIKRFILIQPTKRMDVFGIRFKPPGLSAFMRLPRAELTGSVVPLESVFGVGGRNLETGIIAAESIAEMRRLAEEFLLQRIYSSERDPITERAVAMITRSGGQMTVDGLMQKLRISGRHLERKFQLRIGLSPKTMLRIVRYQRVFSSIQKRPDMQLTELAHLSGYYDQAHFIHDFKDFSGLTPSQYFSNPNLLSDFFTSKEKSDFYN